MEGSYSGGGRSRLYVVGTGPGGLEHVTPAAMDAISKADVVIGYKTYLELIPALLTGKEVISSEMMKEVERCRKALDLAGNGKTVALVSGGDPGIYAMAGLVFELARADGLDVDIRVIPGIAALNACASRLGAPIMHDFAAISLSDLLTPWEVIEMRLKAAASADMVIVLYNPRSKRREGHIMRARDIILEYRPPETPVGIVMAATRDEESVTITDLDAMCNAAINMQTTVIIGNSLTFVWNNRMITPRGYQNKYLL
ncbi:MAG: precorrin-3B C(17)-methyltransferase [Dissulfurimicrobium sp.]|uniref:precorrin-3B C(17)-methyltransferase n=1 Tax=Dissulfurimicrobium TaxID=1769732 RepID=UPI001EDAB51D|nr:precorrin-3B C(17)-methyltransferase [Dissulfurimicrobium hydrothermale]UKL13060.1 precorrin-3B C(17)-methyltransferase [Dissulfurimicrobium hydrothermale]